MKNINKKKIKNWGSIVTLTVNRRVMIIIIRVSLLKSQSRELVGDQWKERLNVELTRIVVPEESRARKRELSLFLSLSLSLSLRLIDLKQKNTLIIFIIIQLFLLLFCVTNLLML